MDNSLHPASSQGQTEPADFAKQLIRDNFHHFFFFKDPVFCKEKECRIVKTTLLEEVPENLHFREMQGMVVPYVEMKFSLSEQEQQDRLPIVELIQGPLVDPILGKKALRLLLYKYGYENVIIKLSKIPLRF